jgi:hypothetical protein
MSKKLIRIVPHEEWVEKQKDLTARQQVWEEAKRLWREKKGPAPSKDVPRN